MLSAKMERERQNGDQEHLTDYELLVQQFNDLDAHRMYVEARQLCKEMFSAAPEKAGETFYRLGLTAWRVGSLRLAEKEFNRAVELLNPNDPMLIRVYNEFSLLEQARGAWIGPYGSLIGWAGLLEGRKRMIRNRHLANALGYSLQSLALYEQLDPEFKSTREGQNLQTHSLDVQGLVYTSGGLFSLAEDNHLKIIEEASQINDKAAVACARNNLGLAYYFEARQRPSERQELLAKAEGCFRKRLEEDEDKTSVGHAIVLSNLARVLETQGKEDEAAEIYSQCRDLYLSLFGPTLLWDATETNHPLLWDARRNITKLTPPGAAGG